MKLKDKQIQNLFGSEIEKRSKIASGSYVGTGTFGENSPTVIMCGFKPKIVFIFAPTGQRLKNGNSTTEISINGGNYIEYPNGIDLTSFYNMYNQTYGLLTERAYAFIQDDASTLIKFGGEQLTTPYGQYIFTVAYDLHKVFTNTGISFYENWYILRDSIHGDPINKNLGDAAYQLNYSGITYKWVAIG